VVGVAAYRKNSTDTRQLNTELTRKNIRAPSGSRSYDPGYQAIKPVGALDLAEAVFGVLYSPTQIIRVII
jgi:hypothetical protein